MNGDESSYAVLFPLPFRVLSLTGLGILGWATNIHGLEALGVDATTILGLRSVDGTHSPLPSTRAEIGYRDSNEGRRIYHSVYRIAALYTIWCLLFWLSFRFLTSGNMLAIDSFRWVPAICIIGLVLILFSPFETLFRQERELFLRSIRRCFLPPHNRPIFFSDVILADILTSFAKVLGDVWLSLCMLLPGNSLLVLPVTEGYSRWLLPIIMSVPYAVRLRQCLIEYTASSNDSRRPLFNALKYATSFPVIFLSAAQRLVESELIEEIGAPAAERTWNSHPLFRLWLLMAAVNSLYSFWWDVTNDWGLDLLQTRVISPPASKSMSPPRPLVLPSLHRTLADSNDSSADFENSGTTSHMRHSSSHAPRYPWGLRPTLLFPLPTYPLVVFLNLVLRLTWSAKLSSHLHSAAEGSEFIFLLEVAEVVRRWMWVFIRVEWELVRKMHTSSGAHHSYVEVPIDEDDFELVGSAGS